MTVLRLLKPFGVLLLSLCLGAAHADKLDDNLQTVWESLWDQRGSPRSVLRWNKPIRYRIHGPDASRHQDHIRSALQAVAEIAHIQIIDVSAQADAETTVALDLEVVKDTDLRDNEPCVTYHRKVNGGALEKVSVKMRSRDTWRCTFHEMMHVMGIIGHPSGKTVLSYFPYRRDALMDLDKLMLAAWYSPAMPENATPLEALVVLSDAVARQSDLGVPAGDASLRSGAFNQRMLQQMESLAAGQGEIPAIILRSGKASQLFIRNAQPVAAFFVGMAYFRGVITHQDPVTAALWFKRGAEKGNLPAQFAWGAALMEGIGVEADHLAGIAWLTLAAKTGIPFIVNFLALVEKKLNPEELEKARAQPAPQVDL